MDRLLCKIGASNQILAYMLDQSGMVRVLDNADLQSYITKTLRRMCKPECSLTRLNCPEEVGRFAIHL